MTTRFINPNNPLRKTASAAPKAVPVPAKRVNKLASAQEEHQVDDSGHFNPTVGSNLANAVRGDKTARMFNKAGELNAVDKKDALRQAMSLVGAATKNSPLASFQRTASAEQLEGQRRAIQAALQSGPEGMALVAQELALPIKAMIDYEGWGRKILRKRTLAQGELFRIARDVRSAAYSIGQDGRSIATQHFGEYILPAEGKITAFAEIDIQEIMQFNYDVLDRIQNTARQAIEIEEDKRVMVILDRAASAVNTVSTFTSTTIAVLEALRYQVERKRLIVDKFLMNRQEMSDLITLGAPNIDPVTQRELLLAGYMGRVLGAYIVVSAGQSGTNEEVVTAGTMYAVSAPEYLGEFAERQSLMSEPYSTWNRLETKKGFGFVEIVGCVIVNPHGCAKAVKS